MSQREVVSLSDRVESESLGFLVYETAKAYANAYAKLMSPLGLTRSQARALACVTRFPGISQVDLGEYLGVGRMATSGLVDRMEAKDLVTRAPDPSDLRVKRVFLTKTAKKMLPDVQMIADALYKSSTASISNKDLRMTKEVLGMIKTNLEQLLTEE